MKTVLLTQGNIAIVDNADFDAIACHNWYALKHALQTRVIWYAVRQAPRTNGKQHLIYMHREILGTKAEVDHIKVDHINGDGLDNRKRNLRPATQTQNQHNRRKTPQCTSRFKGVYWHTHTGKWKAQIKINGQTRHIGLYTSEEAAAAAYDQAAKQNFGDFALTNMKIIKI